METLTFKAFCAPDEPGACAEFLREHRKVLEDFGIQNITTNTESWTSDPDTYVIVAISDKEGMVGGIRVQVDNEQRGLPIHSALIKLDPKIHMTLQELKARGNAEVCGLWNANRYSARNLPSLLAFAAVSLANQIGVQHLVCLVAHYTLRHALKVGFTLMEHLGDGGTFTYPIPSIKAIAMVIPDAISLHTATSPYRQQLISLRIRPEQERVEVLNGQPVKLVYRLCMKGKLIDLSYYRTIMADRDQFSATG